MCAFLCVSGAYKLRKIFNLIQSEIKHAETPKFCVISNILKIAKIIALKQTDVEKKKKVMKIKVELPIEMALVRTSRFNWNLRHVLSNFFPF